MSIEEGCLVTYNGDLYYVLDFDDKDPYIINPTKGAMFIPLGQLTLFSDASSDTEKLINFVFVETGKLMRVSGALNYIESNMFGMLGKIKQIYNRVSTSRPPMPPMPRPRPPMPPPMPMPPMPMPMPPPMPMPTFAVGELVHVGSRQFSVVNAGRFTYELSPNVSGGGGGANVIALKKYVTKDPNLTPEGQRWLDSLYGTSSAPAPAPADALSETPKDLSRAICALPAEERRILGKLTTLDETTEFPIQMVADFALTMFGYTRDIFRSYRDTFDERERGIRGMLNTPNREYNIEYFNMKSGIPVDESSEVVYHAKWMERIFERVIRTGIFTTRRHGIVYRSFAKKVSSAKAVCGMSLNRFTSTTLVKRYADTWGQERDPITNKKNTEGFFSTIIIPAGTVGIIPLILFPDLTTKRPQYEVLLSPNGMLRDTGFVDTAGSKIVVYLDRERCGMSMNEILMMPMEDGTNVLGFIQCVFGDNVTWVGTTGGRRRTKNRQKNKTKRRK